MCHSRLKLTEKHLHAAHSQSVQTVMDSVYAEEPWTMDNQDLIMIVLTCALHGQDCDLNAPWASQEGSAIATSILSSIAKALGSSSRGATIHQSPFSAHILCVEACCGAHNDPMYLPLT